MSTFEIWKLPDVLLYRVAEFVASPTERTSLLCHKVALLNKASYKSILEEEKSVLLWDLVLAGDYGIHPNKQESTRRQSKRLKRCPVDQVRDAHKLLRDNTEIAYFYLWELSSSTSGKGLTRSTLRGILDEYGPHLMINKTVSSGGTFLVEVCRARNVNKVTILHCVQELVEQRGALVDLKTNESSNSSLTALCAAAARGMPKVVEYLLSKAARKDITCSARFRLSTNSKKSLRCVGTPIEFASAMLEAEKAEGATNQELADLRRSIRLLTTPV
eukprot:scaffold1900_cov123-Cylindrotheca_fusiformis.AAC.48